MKKSMPRKLVSFAVIAALGVGGYLTYNKYNGNKAEAVTYQASEVQRGRVTSQVTATGTLQPRVTVQVGSQVSGRILELHADFNTEVKKGQLLAKLDPKLLDASVLRSKASQTSAQASLGKASALKNDAYTKYKRAKALAAKKLVAQAEVDSAWASYQSAKASVTSAWADLQQAKAALDQSKTNAAYATVISPIDGVVISRSVDVGQTVAASLSAPTLFTIAENLTKMEIHTSVAESDVGKVAPNQRVNFTVDAYPGERFNGVVKQIRYSPKTESNVVTYDAVVEVENKELKLRPGMTANVTFIVAQKRDALLVPNAALRFRPSAEVMAKVAPPAEAAPARRPRTAQNATGKRPEMTDAQRAERRKRFQARRNKASKERTIWLLDETGMPKPVKVTVGITDGSVTEIVKGDLEQGAKVIIGTGKGAGKTKPAARGRGGNRRGGRGGRSRSFL